MPRVGLDKTKVIEQAAKLANEKGLDGVTITTLAQYIGIKKPSLYNHIKSQEDIYREIMLYGWNQVSEKIKNINEEDGCESLKKFCVQFYQYATKNPGIFEAMLWYNRYTDKEQEAVTDTLYEFFFKQTDQLKINREIANHLLRTYRAFLEGFLLLVIHDAFGNPISIEESFDISIGVLLRGIQQYENTFQKIKEE